MLLTMKIHCVYKQIKYGGICFSEKMCVAGENQQSEGYYRNSSSQMPEFEVKGMLNTRKA